MFALLMLPLLILFRVVKGLALIIFIVGLGLPLLQKETVDQLLRLPVIESVSPIFIWLTEHGLHLCLVLTFLTVLSLLRKTSRLQIYQQKQSFVLGGLMHYLEVSDFRFSYGIEEAKRSGLSFDSFLNQRLRSFWARLIGGEEGGEFFAGTDPFDTALKRGDTIATLREDVKQHVKETMS